VQSQARHTASLSVFVRGKEANSSAICLPHVVYTVQMHNGVCVCGTQLLKNTSSDAVLTSLDDRSCLNGSSQRFITAGKICLWMLYQHQRSRLMDCRYLIRTKISDGI
jgi:hypothetical protein